MSNSIQQVHQLGQAIWLDYIRRNLLKSGELKQLIEQGISGVTSNPTIFERAIIGSTDYDEALLASAQTERSTGQIYESLAIQDIRTAADQLRPTYDQTQGWHGYVSLEVSPSLAYDTQGTIEEARRLFLALERPNVLIKVPATPEGIPAIRQLISDGINVNITLIFSLDCYQQVMEAYIAGVEELVGREGDTSRVTSVASFFVSRIDTAVDTLLEERIRKENAELRGLLGKTAIANAKLAYRAFKNTFQNERFVELRVKGGRVQRPLWASTGTKNPAYSDVKYVESLIGADTVNTLPLATVDAFLDHGYADITIEKGLDEAEETLSALTAADISLEQVTTELLTDGVKAFADSFDKLLAGIEKKRGELLAKEHIHPGVSIGGYLGDVEATLAKLEQDKAVARIWHKDYTVWKPDPAEISNRLGWLTVTDLMHEQVPSLETLGREVREAGFTQVLLLGMGGSSLGPEVISQTFGSTRGYPRLVVLEAGACITPAQIDETVQAIEPLDTLLVISSKSGTTIEPLSIFDYFTSLIESAVGEGKLGENIVTITDPGTPLARLVEERGLGHLFLNPPDIGGRYSVLSNFGMVPAAAIGLDVGKFLDRAERMREGSASCVPAHENDAAWLGACIGKLALQGRDKLTLVTSPGISGFGLWVEQLLAESTGKEGKGIIPVVGEPLLEPTCYGDDRLFVYLRLQSDDNAETDRAIEQIRSAGQPVVTLEMQDRYDLGAEFFCWEFATAVAGAVLGIHPFNQPDVQRAKDATERVLQEYLTSGQLPKLETTGELKDLLAEAEPGSYLAIMAYICQSPEMDQAFTELRRKVVEKHGIATTLGYGPRFLHSTGQLHKGGPNKGLFLQITTDHQSDVSIPGKPYSFGVVADAQTIGDFQALQSLGRRVVRIHLPRCDSKAISKMVDELA